MYLAYYGLREPPFSITPDPRFVHLGERHRDALAHLLFGIDKGGGGGFVQLTGEVGTGKTTLCRLLLEQLPENARVALVLNPQQTPVELLETICEELRIDVAGKHGSSKALVDALNRHLLEAYAQGLRVVLIIDEAQDLSVEALEQVRLLTNLETDTQKLLQVILLGQPELRDILARADLRQLAQRITARFHLTPLDAVGSERYLRHRYAVAGGTRLPFDKAAIRRLHDRAGGVPRLLNVIAERSLLAGYARDETTIGRRLVDLAAREALPPRRAMPMSKPAWVAALALCIAAAMVAAFAWRRPVVPPASASVASHITHPKAVAPPKSVVVPSPPVPAVAQLDAAGLAQRIAAAGLARDAWHPLLSAWRLPTSDNDLAIAERCAADLAPGVHCLRARGNLDRLVAIDRPVLLRLHASGDAAWALLQGSDALRARIELGGEVVDVPRVLLQRAWPGDYAAVWRDGAAATPSAASGGDIRAFQAAHGLAVDGIAGPETRFALAAGAPGPHLQALP
jgi:general secretion pathway protein A